MGSSERKQIGPYTVVREIGRGGMGVVFLATDARLDRDVAIKALPEELASDPERLARFEREARALAQLNHPNVAGIYGLEEQDGQRYLVLEYVEGDTLEDRIDQSALPVDEAIETAILIAAGVEAAHEAGIVHRDLKPANIKITPDGEVKVLDFGLARSDDPTTSTTEVADAETAVRSGPRSPTVPGVIMGTAPYMSPEQARGRRVDKRSDIWSFGVVLYEMLTGSALFHGETASDSIGAVLHKDIDLDQLPPATPSHVRRVLSRCLERDKNLRYRDIGDVRIELVRRGDARAEETAHASGGLSAATVLALVVVAGGIAGVAGWFASRALLPTPHRVVRKLEVYAAGPDDKFDAMSPRISPDGMKIAFIQEDAIRIRDLSTFSVRTVAEAKGVKQVVWSPDGRTLVYATARELFRIPATGGGAARLAEQTVNFQLAWSEDDRLLFSDDTNLDQPGISEMPARGGTPRMLLAADRAEVIDFHSVATIPGTGVLLFVRHRTDQRTPIEAWDGSRSVVIADFEDQYVSSPVWSPSGHVLFARGFGEFNIWAVPFSPERMEVTGDPFLVQTDASAPSVSADGTLSFVRGSAGLSGELVWVLPDGSTETIGDGGAFVQWPVVSPDGSRVAFAGGTSPQEMEIWVRDLERGINTRISSLDGFVIPVAWSPDGTEIAVMNFDPSRTEESQTTVFLATDGSGQTREPYPGLLAAIDPEWSRAVQASDPRSGATTVSAVDLSKMSQIGEVIAIEGAFLFFSLSPAGDLLLYESRESGESQVFCTRFPSGEGRWQISADGGTRPHWSPDGTMVYYMDADRELKRVALTREPTMRFGIPEKVFPTMPELADFASLHPSSDGERFISIRGRDEEAAQAGYQLMLIENWFEEFRSDDRP